MIDRNSKGYIIGRFLGRLTLAAIGYIVGKKWGQRPINKGYPKKK